MANYSRYYIQSYLHVFYLIVAQIKQTSNYLNHMYYLLSNINFPDATHLSV